MRRCRVATRYQSAQFLQKRSGVATHAATRTALVGIALAAAAAGASGRATRDPFAFLAPDVIVGTGDKGKTREHCAYPAESVWDDEDSDWVCVD